MIGADFLTVYLRDGDYVDALPEAQSSLDAHVDALHSGNRDRIIAIPLVDGATFAVLASHVVGWRLSTAEMRAREAEWEKAQEEEAKRIRLELGIFED